MSDMREDMTWPSKPVIEAALRGIETTDANDLIERLPPPRNAFQQRVVEELERLELTRLLWNRTSEFPELEIWRRGRYVQLTAADARELLLDRYREVDMHERVRAWIDHHPDTPKEEH